MLLDNRIYLDMLKFRSLSLLNMTFNMNHSFTRLVTKRQLCARDVAGTGHMVDRINRAKGHTVTESWAPSLHHFLPTALLLVSLVRKLTQGAKDIKKAVYMGTRMGAATRGQRQGSEPEAREALAQGEPTTETDQGRGQECIPKERRDDRRERPRMRRMEQRARKRCSSSECAI